MTQALNVRFKLEAACAGCKVDMSFFDSEELKEGKGVCDNCGAQYEITSEQVAEAKEKLCQK